MSTLEAVRPGQASGDARPSVRLEVTRREPFAGGHVFGEGGVYERIDGVLHFSVDPVDPANARITDLNNAERGPDGLVHFSADLCLLQPVDPARSGRRLLLEVPNRGRKGALGRFNRPAPAGSPPLPNTRGINVGDGLLMRLGWTIAWCGWQWDVLRDQAPNGLLGFDPPQAVDESGKPNRGKMLLEWQPNELQTEKLLADRVHAPYPAADLDEDDAILWQREHPQAPRVEIARELWSFARAGATGPIPDATHVTLQGGFKPGVIYDLSYTTSNCPVVGTGLLALRDCVSFLRHGTAAEGNPSAGRLDYTLGTGSSQCGRLLRDFLKAGLNTDPEGRRVFDGILINVAGSRGGEFNHRYAQPSVITIPSFGYVPQRFQGWPEDVKVISINTSAEYWNREASLLHIDETGQRDVEPPSNVRIYHYAGTKHGPGTLQSGEDEEAPVPLGVSGQRPNVVDFTPLLRAGIFHLERWVSGAAAPPPSKHPRLADGTAIPPEKALDAYHVIPGAVVPDPSRLFQRRHLDLGPEADKGVPTLPAKELGDPFPWFVAALDEDGNEVGSIRLPDISVPVATHTGWFPRKPGTGGDLQNTDMLGTTIPFPKDAATRAQRGDPRLSIAERYRDASDYEAQVRAATAQLVADGYLLAEDTEIVVQNAVERFRAFA